MTNPKVKTHNLIVLSFWVKSDVKMPHMKHNPTKNYMQLKKY